MHTQQQISSIKNRTLMVIRIKAQFITAQEAECVKVKAEVGEAELSDRRKQVEFLC